MSSAFETLATVSLCRHLPLTVIRDIADLCWTIQKAPGTNIQYHGETVYAVYVVESGRVRISRSAVNGRELVLALSGRGTCLNLGALLDNGPCSLTVDAVDDTALLMIPLLDLQELAERESDLMQAIAAELARQERRLLDLLDSIALHNLPARLAALLLSDAARVRDGYEPVAHTQDDLAARLGTVRETVARTLRSFVQRGLIRLDARNIIIVNQSGLERVRDS